MSINRVMRYWVYKLLMHQPLSLMLLFAYGVILESSAFQLTMSLLTLSPYAFQNTWAAWLLLGLMTWPCALFLSLPITMAFLRWLQSPSRRGKTRIPRLIVGPMLNGFVVSYAAFHLAAFMTPLADSGLSAQDWQLIRPTSLLLAGLSAGLVMMKPCQHLWHTMQRMCSMR
ncbi:hypothetical protein AOX56_05530 [Aeromonas sobria]|uniref:Uncharacterized protein n=1 Tax=Aeromonas sobria TaxID=646 RepID=A0A2N3IRK9_AERSO|nr:hypothetical protein AOX56_05530 [Aeromonas sobria]